MKTRFFHMLAATLAFATLAGAPAFAQTSPPRDPKVIGPTTAEDVRALYRFGQCLARRDTVGARRLLAMDSGAAENERAYQRFVSRNDNCQLGGMLRFSPMLFLGAMAETLVRWRADGDDLAAATALDPSRPPIVASSQAEMMGLCTVRAAPTPVAALLATEPGGPEEAAAVRALTPQIRDCLTAGIAARLNRRAIRALLAVAAYRLSEERRQREAEAQ